MSVAPKRTVCTQLTKVSALFSTGLMAYQHLGDGTGSRTHDCSRERAVSYPLDDATMSAAVSRSVKLGFRHRRQASRLSQGHSLSVLTLCVAPV